MTEYMIYVDHCLHGTIGVKASPASTEWAVALRTARKLHPGKHIHIEVLK